MKNTNKYVSFKRLEFNNGQDIFEFSDNKRTVIVGKSGSGKSTITNFLASLDVSDDDSTVVTEGERSLIEKHNKLIFITDEYGLNIGYDVISSYKDYPDDFKAEMSLVLNELFLNKSWVKKKYNNLDFYAFSGGERVLIYYSYIFATRNLSSVTIPLVLDSPFSILDVDLRNRLSRYLNQDGSQQIIFLTPSEYDDSLFQGKVDYTLKEIFRS